MSVYPRLLTPKDVWEYPPFRIRYVYDNTASAETNSSSWTELKSYTFTLPRPLASFKLRIRCIRRVRNNTSTSYTASFRAVITADSLSYTIDLGSIPYGAGQADYALDTAVAVDLPSVARVLNVSLQACTNSTYMYASYQPLIVIEAGYLFSGRVKLKDGVLVPPEIVEEELESKIDSITNMLKRVLEILEKRALA